MCPMARTYVQVIGWGPCLSVHKDMLAIPTRNAVNDWSARGGRCAFVWAAIALLAAVFTPAVAQQEAVFEAETTLMEFEVRATDRQGRPVTDLRKDDFEVFEGGQRQSVATFEFVTAPEPREPDAPADRLPRDPGSASARAAGDLRRSTFVYIATRGRREDRRRIFDAVTDFIEKQLAPGMLVSIEGSPFTSRRSDLDSLLRDMRGRSGDTQAGPSFVDTLAVDLARDISYSDEFEALVEEANDEFEDQIEEISDRAAFYRRLRMYEYIDLIRALSIYPGRKIVVLFATGLPVDEDNLDIMKVLEDEATKARVRFYVSDVSGLGASPPGGDAEQAGDFAALFGDLGGASPAAGQSRQDNQDGLFDLARRTGGRAVLNSNDFGEVFDVVMRESGDYYLLGYYPRNTEQRGRLRRLRVRVRRPGVKLSHQRGYYEEHPFALMSRREQNLRMHQALSFDTPYTDLPLRVDHEIFRSSSGTPTLVYSVGLHTGDLPSAASHNGRKVKLTVIAQASRARNDAGRPIRPLLDERRFEMTVDNSAFERLSNDPNSWLHYGSQMPLEPGRYNWKVVVRDDVSGALGSFQTELLMPEMRGKAAASSLLLTSRIDDVGGPGPNAKRTEALDKDVLRVEGSRFFASAVKAFRKGEPLFLLYDIYNPDPESLAEPPAAKLALYRGTSPVDRIPVTSHQTVPQPRAGRIRHLAALATTELEAGSYVIAAMLRSESRDRAVIFRRFEILDPEPRAAGN